MKVLVLEGDVLVSRGLERTLRVLGHEVRCPASVDAARASLLEDPAVDVVLAAQHLGADARGSEFLRWVEAHVPHARRVLISGTPCPEDFVERPGEQCFQPKPFGRRELEALLSSPRASLPPTSHSPGPQAGRGETR